MSGARHGSNLLMKAMGAFALAGATATMASVVPSTSSCPSMARGATPAAANTNRWVSKALATRGGAEADEEGAGGGDDPESIAGVMSEVEIAVSSFNDIVGENLLVVDNAKKGTTKEVRRLVCFKGGGRSGEIVATCIECAMVVGGGGFVLFSTGVWVW